MYYRKGIIEVYRNVIVELFLIIFWMNDKTSEEKLIKAFPIRQKTKRSNPSAKISFPICREYYVEFSLERKKVCAFALGYVLIWRKVEKVIGVIWINARRRRAKNRLQVFAFLSFFLLVYSLIYMKESIGKKMHSAYFIIHSTEQYVILDYSATSVFTHSP